MRDFTDSTVIVTGASSGIGLGIARGFLDGGARVVLNGRDPGKLDGAARALGRPERVAEVAGDIGAATTGEALVRTAVERFGGVDVLVNNAGAFVSTPFTEVTEEELDGFLLGGLKGTYLTTQAAVRRMREQGRGGSVVVIGSALASHSVGALPCSAPSAGKGGVYALTTALAAELAPDGIRVNMVAPGVIRTRTLGRGAEERYASVGLLGRLGEVGEVAEAVLYIAGAEFVTGQVLRVDGGHTTGRTG
ncbi:SDR family NAD(P)-dependent oxidoreductase [Streptomyces clavuligerus]|nr:SDR family oxidoreductase [Streptomyces clavuligerus]ANW20503.1 glucose dehydrogenase [Streptomyces clavuligerus]AXU15129.1 SDR family oxidoreductase [Streptomyces clavuligerus]MBY6305193.1 SDR family oxidoreductase [Streptomyces clavuligerus]QCS07904.1 KR domain-containing protein [Streptomyces clavuligerus]QPJ92761.1 SDR family oxidoreductase [Streptomyces clavuligerus]